MTGDRPPVEAYLAVQRLVMRHYRFRVGDQHDPFRCRLCGSVFDEHLCGMQNGA
jgi:hypothetical protein